MLATPSNIISSMLTPPLYAVLTQEPNMHVSAGSHCQTQLRHYQDKSHFRLCQSCHASVTCVGVPFCAYAKYSVLCCCKPSLLRQMTHTQWHTLSIVAGQKSHQCSMWSRAYTCSPRDRRGDFSAGLLRICCWLCLAVVSRSNVCKPTCSAHRFTPPHETVHMLS